MLDVSVISELSHAGSNSITCLVETKTAERFVIKFLWHPPLEQYGFLKQVQDSDHFPKVVKVDNLNKFYIMFEHIDKTPLKANSDNDLLAIIRQLFLCVRHLHSKRIMHRRIYYKNILLQKGTRKVVLCDFGAAAEFPSDFYTSPPAPNNYYLPDALRFNGGSYNHTIDLYACTFIWKLLLEMLHPEQPVTAESQPIMHDIFANYASLSADQILQRLPEV